MRQTRGLWPRAMLILAATVWAGVALADAPPQDGVRVVVEGPACPYISVKLEMVRRHGTPMAVVRRVFPKPFGHHQALALVPEDEFRAILGRVAELARPRPTRAVRSPRVRYTIDYNHAGERFSITLDDPESNPHPAPRALVKLLRGEIEGRAGAPEFRDELMLPEEFGLLRLNAEPEARATLDGITPLGVTPLDHLKIPVGRHEIRLEPVGGGAAEVYTVEIEAGRTTALTVEIK